MPQPRLQVLAGGGFSFPRLPRLSTGTASPQFVALLVIVEVALLVGLRNIFKAVHGG